MIVIFSAVKTIYYVNNWNYNCNNMFGYKEMERGTEEGD